MSGNCYAALNRLSVGPPSHFIPARATSRSMGAESGRSSASDCSGALQIRGQAAGHQDTQRLRNLVNGHLWLTAKWGKGKPGEPKGYPILAIREYDAQQ